MEILIFGGIFLKITVRINLINETKLNKISENPTCMTKPLPQE